MNQVTEMTDRQLAYVVFRLSLGVNILIHGYGRLFGPGAGTFASKTMTEFAVTPLPRSLTYVFLVTLPLVELMVGTLIGLFTRAALTVGGFLITALIFGTALRSDWAAVGIQMIYSITYYLLLVNRSENRFSLYTLLLSKPAVPSR
jgi:thiosulfate dehydrogenase [quinone] large subunit